MARDNTSFVQSMFVRDVSFPCAREARKEGYVARALFELPFVPQVLPVPSGKLLLVHRVVVDPERFVIIE